MKSIPALLLLLISVTNTYFANGQIAIDTIGNTTVHIETVIDSSYFNGDTSLFYAYLGPWDLHWGPDDKLWFGNKSSIQRYDPLTGEIDTLITLPSGMVMGITTHSNFDSEPYVYAAVDTSEYYAGSGKMELYRFTYNAITQKLEEQLFILDWFHPGEHSGGRVIFGKDEKVYVSTAEYWAGNDSLFNNSGKILRINPDGSVPDGNPTPDYTWTRGHRNPQGLAGLPNGNIISSEHGQIAGNDELNLIERDGNYGWIYFDGNTCITDPDTCDFYRNIYKFPIDTGGNPPSGIDYYDHSAIPELNGIMEAVTGSYQGIIVYELNEELNEVVSQGRHLGAAESDGSPAPWSSYGRIRDVCATPDGKVYFIAHDRNHPRINVIYNPSYVNIEDHSHEVTFSLSPNPASDELQIHTSGKSPKNGVIYNIQGTVIRQYPNLTDNQFLNISDLPNGLYIFKLHGEPGNHGIEKFIIIR